VKKLINGFIFNEIGEINISRNRGVPKERTMCHLSYAKKSKSMVKFSLFLFCRKMI